MAHKAKRKGSKNGSQKRSAKNQVNRKNRAAAAPRRRGSRSMGRDIGRGKPLEVVYYRDRKDWRNVGMGRRPLNHLSPRGLVGLQK